MQEQLAKLAQRERESAAAKGLDELTPAFITERQKACREQENAKMLVRDAISFTSRSHKGAEAKSIKRGENILDLISH